MKGKKYLWTEIDDDKMLLWTPSSMQRYLTHPTKFLPDNLIRNDRRGKIQMPPNPDFSQLHHLGFPKAGFASKSGRYFYQYIGNNPFSSFVLVVNGELPISFDGKKYTLRKGDSMVVPPNKTCMISGVKHSPTIFWMHCEKRWKFPSHILIKKMERFKQLLFLGYAYMEEIYSENPNISFLRSLSEAIAECIRVEFFGMEHNLKYAFLEKILHKNPPRMNARALAKELKIPIFEIDKFCLKKYGLKLAKLLLKMRMEKALGVLKAENSSCAKAAKAAGYATQFSFSKAFEKYYGTRPSIFLKNS